MTSTKVEQSRASRALSQALITSIIAPSSHTFMKGKSVQMEASLLSQGVAKNDMEVYMRVVEDFDALSSAKEDETHVCSQETTETPPVMPSNKRRKTFAIWECFPELFVTIGDATYAMYRYCKKNK